MPDKIVQDVEHAPGGMWSKLRHMNKYQLAALGVGSATLVVGFLAWRSMQAGTAAATGINPATGLPTDTSGGSSSGSVTSGAGADPTSSHSTSIAGPPYDASASFAAPRFAPSTDSSTFFASAIPTGMPPTTPTPAPTPTFTPSIVAATAAKGLDPSLLPGFATPVQPANYLTTNPNTGNPNIAIALINKIVAAAQQAAPSPPPPVANPNAGNPIIAVHTVQAIVTAAQAAQHQATPAPPVPIVTASVSGKRSGGAQMVV